MTESINPYVRPGATEADMIASAMKIRKSNLAELSIGDLFAVAVEFGIALTLSNGQWDESLIGVAGRPRAWAAVLDWDDYQWSERCHDEGDYYYDDGKTTDLKEAVWQALDGALAYVMRRWKDAEE